MPSYRDLQIIHVAKRKLGLSDDVYRGIMQEQFGKDSAAKLTPIQAHKLIAHFKTLGFKLQRKRGKGNHSKPQDAQERKIVAMWITLHKAGVIKDKSDRALQKFVKRMTKIDKLSWCDSSHKHIVIEALKGIKEREDEKLV